MKEQRLIGYLSNGFIKDRTVQEIRNMDELEYQQYSENVQNVGRLFMGKDAAIQADFITSYLWLTDNVIRGVPELVYKRRLKRVQNALDIKDTTGIWLLEYLIFTAFDVIEPPLFETARGTINLCCEHSIATLSNLYSSVIFRIGLHLTQASVSISEFAMNCPNILANSTFSLDDILHLSSYILLYFLLSSLAVLPSLQADMKNKTLLYDRLDGQQ